MKHYHQMTADWSVLTALIPKQANRKDAARNSVMREPTEFLRAAQFPT